MGYPTLLLTVLALALVALTGVLLAGRRHWPKKTARLIRETAALCAGAAAGALILGSLPAVIVVTVGGDIDERYTMWLLAAIGAFAGLVLSGAGNWLLRRKRRSTISASPL